MRVKLVRWFFFLCLIIFSAGCAEMMVSRILPAEETPTALAMVTATPTPYVPPEITELPVQPVSLRVWLPPEFAPVEDNHGGKLLEARLKEFQTRHEMRVEIRVKALDGEGGMVNALTTANAAAPLALPDVVALPRVLLEKAALKGLLYPLDEYDSILNAPDWYEYTRQLANIQGSTYGIPFAGDAQVVVYRTKVLGKPPRTWDAVLASKYALMFPAGEADAFFPIAQYIANGNSLQDSEGRPQLDPDALTKVFNFFEQAQRGEQMPYWLSQYETDDQAWQAFLDNRSPLVVTWLSRYLKNPPADTAIGVIPTSTGEDFGLMRGWLWVVTTPDPQRRKLGAELIQYMVMSEFTSAWTETAGYLPPQMSAFQTWQDGNRKQTAERVIAAGHVAPASDVLSVISPVLKDVTVRILKNQIDAPTAAQEAANKVKSPQ